MTEQQRHKEYFEYYYSLGKARSLAEVSRHFNVSAVSMSKFNREFNWDERVKQRDKEYLFKRINIDKADQIMTLNDISSVVRKSLMTYMNNLNNNKIKIESVNDLSKLASVYMQIIECMNAMNEKELGSIEKNTTVDFGFFGKKEEDESESA
jgi:hypothetical protein